MINELHNLPVLDWHLSLKLAGNQAQLASDILNSLLESLPRNLKEMHTLYAEKKFTQLCEKTHQLHGIICYCGTPRLKKVVAQLESALKKNIHNEVPILLDQLIIENSALREDFSKHSRLSSS